MITCGKDSPLCQSSALPDVSAAVGQLLQNMRVGVVQKAQINGMTQEVPLWREAMASIQPMSEKLSIMKEGERSWRWYELFVQPDINLETDDIVVIAGTGYRIMSKVNWEQYGFIRYDCIEHYKKFEE